MGQKITDLPTPKLISKSPSSLVLSGIKKEREREGKGLLLQLIIKISRVKDWPRIQLYFWFRIIREREKDKQRKKERERERGRQPEREREADS